jgi:excisionase family DNA binding protein
MEKLLYRPKEAALVLGIGRDKLYDLMRSGRLRSVKDGGARFITAGTRKRVYVYGRTARKLTTV